MKKHTIILIDDDKWLTDLYGTKLQQEGFNIFCANNGVEGSKLINIYKPDLILLDIVMSNGDGFYVLKKLKQNKETKDIPIIILTNLSNSADRNEALKLGASEYLVKVDYTPSQVVEKIKAILAASG